MAELSQILDRLYQIFQKINIKYVIVGGLAAIMRSKPRTTMDIDIILERDLEKKERISLSL